MQSVKYLGVTISRNKDIFHQHVQNLCLRLRSATWAALTCASRLYRQVAYVSKIWNMYVLSAVFNSSEIFIFSNSLLDKLERVQNLFMRSLLRTSMCTPVVAMQFELAIFPLRTYLMRKQVQYYQYIANISQQRVVFKAYVFASITMVPGYNISELVQSEHSFSCQVKYSYKYGFYKIANQMYGYCIPIISVESAYN